MDGQKPNEWISVREAGRRGSYTSDLILVLIHEGVLTATKPKGRRGYRICVADFDNYMKGTQDGRVRTPATR